MKAGKLIYVISIAVLMAGMGCSMSDSDDDDNVEPVYYFYGIKASILDYLYLSTEQLNQINGLVTSGELVVLQLKIDGVLNELSNADVSEEGTQQKINNTVTVLTGIKNLTDIETIRDNYFTRYNYTIKGSTRSNMYLNKEQQRKLENLVTRGNLDNLKKGIAEIIDWLNSEHKKSNSTYAAHNIKSTIAQLEYINTMGSIDDIRLYYFTLNAL